MTADARHQYHLLEVSRVIRETEEACSLVFQVPEALRPLYTYRAGQFLTLELSTDDRPAARRCYSLASSPDRDSDLKVTVKRVAGGRVSNWINDNVRAGHKIPVLPPDGRFVLSPHTGPLVFFAGGSGITPIISLIKTTLVSTKRTMLLVYANRNEQSIIFKSELDQLAAGNPERLRIGWWLDAKHGYMTGPQVQQLLRQEQCPETYLCGPRPFMDCIEEALLQMKYEPSLIHVESFFSLSDGPVETIAAPVAPTPILPSSAPSPPTLEILLDGKTQKVPCKPGSTLLGAALLAGLDAPHSCQEGVCGSCIAKLLDGEVDMVDTGVLSKSDRKRNMIVTCQSKLKSSSAKIDYSAV